MRWPTGSLPTSSFFCSDSVLFLYSLSPQKLFGGELHCACGCPAVWPTWGKALRFGDPSTELVAVPERGTCPSVPVATGSLSSFFLFLSLRSLALAFSLLLQRRFVAAQRFGDIKKYALSLHFAVNKVGSLFGLLWNFLGSRICSSLSAIVAKILVPETLWWNLLLHVGYVMLLVNSSTPSVNLEYKVWDYLLLLSWKFLLLDVVVILITRCEWTHLTLLVRLRTLSVNLQYKVWDHLLLLPRKFLFRDVVAILTTQCEWTHVTHLLRLRTLSVNVLCKCWDHLAFFGISRLTHSFYLRSLLWPRKFLLPRLCGDAYYPLPMKHVTLLVRLRTLSINTWYQVWDRLACLKKFLMHPVYIFS